MSSIVTTQNDHYDNSEFIKYKQTVNHSSNKFGAPLGVTPRNVPRQCSLFFNFHPTLNTIHICSDTIGLRSTSDKGCVENL